MRSDLFSIEYQPDRRDSICYCFKITEEERRRGVRRGEERRSEEERREEE
jgi:hypothetical protein